MIVGIAIHSRDDASVDQAMACADLALYRAKEQGRNRVVVPADAPTPRDDAGRGA